jgi:hypothetical protein
MIALSKEKRFQIVKKGDEMPETNKWKRLALMLIVGEVLGFVVAITAYSYVHQTNPEQKGLVPVWVEPKHKQSIEEYHKILRKSDGVRAGTSDL